MCICQAVSAALWFHSASRKVSNQHLCMFFTSFYCFCSGSFSKAALQQVLLTLLLFDQTSSPCVSKSLYSTRCTSDITWPPQNLVNVVTVLWRNSLTFPLAEGLMTLKIKRIIFGTLTWQQSTIYFVKVTWRNGVLHKDLCDCVCCNPSSSIFALVVCTCLHMLVFNMAARSETLTTEQYTKMCFCKQ